MERLTDVKTRKAIPNTTIKEIIEKLCDYENAEMYILKMLKVRKYEMNTVITIEQKRRTTHEIIIKGKVFEDQMNIISQTMLEAYDIEDIILAVAKLGFKIISADYEGCYEGCDFEFINVFQDDDE